MLRIYDVILEFLRMLVPVIREIERHDRDLARQLRRSATSMALNTGEGSGSSGGTRTERYKNALSSARETGCNLDSAIALEYVHDLDAQLLDRLDHIRAVLFKNIR
jgi:four helix bundle protein